MKTIIVYPLPFDNWVNFVEDFNWEKIHSTERFTATFRWHPPGADYELHAICQWGEQTDAVRENFRGIKTKFYPNYEGCEALCAHLAVARMVDEAFLVCLTTRTYFHREGWLKRLLEARYRNGPGMYSTCASMEGSPHLCTRGYGIDAGILRNWPGDVTGREDSHVMEVGDKALTRWCQANRWATAQVLWDSEQLKESEWRDPDNIFRRGNQEQMLWWDRHTAEYASADPETKKRLEKLSDGA